MTLALWAVLRLVSAVLGVTDVDVPLDYDGGTNEWSWHGVTVACSIAEDSVWTVCDG